MMKLRLFVLALCGIGAILLITILYSLSIKNVNRNNAFVRILPLHKIVENGVLNMNYNSWYFSGIYNRYLFLGNITAPGKIIKIDTLLRNKGIEISLTGFDSLHLFGGTKVQLDDLNVYVMDGVKPIILKGNILDLHLNTQIKTPYFTSTIPLTKSSFAIRYVNKKYENVLAKLTNEFSSLKSTHLLEKQVDGMFCTDGEMVKIPRSSKMIYVYYYRNQFLCVDSNLNLLYKGKTIDTVAHAQIKVTRIKSSGQITMAAPPLYVNKRACANEKYLFVQSALRANNETDYMIKDVSVIDVYAVKDGKYQFSFYLPDFRGFKVRDFKVYGQSLYALYDHYLYKYQLNF